MEAKMLKSWLSMHPSCLNFTTERSARNKVSLTSPVVQICTPRLREQLTRMRCASTKEENSKESSLGVCRRKGEREVDLTEKLLDHQDKIIQVNQNTNYWEDTAHAGF